MAHLALYREFRPQRFADVVGQEHITRTLRNALKMNRLHHAYLLSGPRGTGKTTVARLLAKAVNCLNPHDGEPCNECVACRSIISGETMDVIEIDAASNRGIDEIRDLRDKVKYAPAELRRKVYIIDEVHMLSEPAFNALLKTLEEPPAHVMFVLATTEKQKLPVTIISRCQSFEYHRLSAQEIVGRLQEVCTHGEVKATEEALAAIARQAEGGMRDALSLLDQVMAYSIGGQITLDDTLHVLGSAPLDQFLKLDHLLAQGEVGGALLLLDELVRQGKDLRQFVRDYLGHMRDLLLLQVDTTGTSLDLPQQSLSALRTQAGAVQQPHLLTGIRLLAQLEGDLRHSASPRLLVEVALIRLGGVLSGKVAEAAVEAPPPLPQPKAAGAATPVQPVKASTPSVDPVESLHDGDTPTEPPLVLNAAPPAPSGEGVDQVVKAWDQVLDLVKKARPSTHIILSQGRIGRMRGTTLIVVAPNEAFAGLLRRPADKSIIEKALAKVGLTGIEVHAVGPDDPAGTPDPGTAAQTAVEKPATSQTLVDAVKRVFPPDLVVAEEEEGSS